MIPKPKAETREIPREPPKHPSPARLGTAALISVSSFLLFLALRSNLYMAVDGAVRCLDVFHRGTLFFHGTNHLLYPAWILLWNNSLSVIGVRAADAVQYMRNSQAMNAVAAALCLGLFFLILNAAVRDWRIALSATVALGFSRAYLQHATNAAEPMVGLFFSLLAFAVAVESLRRGIVWGLWVAGSFLAFALASYQSMILAAPLAFVVCAAWPSERGRSRLWRAGSLAAGAVVAVCAIEAFVAWQARSPVAGDRVRSAGLTGAMFSPSAEAMPHVYAGVRPSRIANFPIGFAGNLLNVLPSGYGGMRSLFRETRRWLWIAALFGALAASASVGVLLVQPLFSYFRHRPKTDRIVITALVLAAAPVFFPLIYWDPLYDKLWLQAMCALVAATALLLDRHAPFRTRARVTPILGLLLVAEIALNGSAAYAAAKAETPFLAEARQVARVVTRHDVLVTDFNEIGILHLYFQDNAVETIVLPASRPPEIYRRLEDSIRRRRAEGGRVYFLGVLDQSRETWDGFLGRRVGVPFEAFDIYRQNSAVILSFPYKGSTVCLRQLN